MSEPSPTPPSRSRHLIAPELLVGLERMPSLPLSDSFIAQLRQMVGTGQAQPSFEAPPLPPAYQAVLCEQRFIPGLAGEPDVRVLVYTPPHAASAPRPAYLHMHGGGFVLGSPEINDSSNRAYASDLDCVVVSVDYRLAPETRFPGALNDCYAALLWLHDQAEALGVDRARIAIGGESAGGGHAATLALHARDKGEVAICFQLLEAPMLDDRTGSSREPNPYCGEFVWTPEQNRYGWSALLGMAPGGNDVPAGAVPARAASLEGLPPACITVGALDLFMDENVNFAGRMMQAGIPTELHVIPGGYHGFGAAGPQAPLVRMLLDLRRNALARALGVTPAA